MNKFEFPYKTLDWMIELTKNKLKIKVYNDLHLKLIYIKKMTDINKMNRWFGYYQKVGQDLEFWTLDEIIKKVREERDSYPKNLKNSEICLLCTEKYGIGDMNCANPIEHKPDKYCRLEHVHDTPRKHIWGYNPYTNKKYCTNCGYKIKIELEYRSSDEVYLETLKYNAKIDCKSCENKQADNVDTIEHMHPCYDCLGSCYETEMLYMHSKNNFKLKEDSEIMEKYIKFMGDKYHG